MKRILIQNAHTVITMNSQKEVLHNVDIEVYGSMIKKIGKIDAEDTVFDTVIDARKYIVLPGFVNTHHHLYQTLTRNIPLVQDVKLFDWLVNLYEIWREMDEEAVRISTFVGLGELLLSGCTTAADHFYLFPQKATPMLLDVEINAARETGIRFHPTRGSMSRGHSRGGLPPDDVVQSEDEILNDSARLIDLYHDPEPFSMCRVSLAPCSPFSVTEALMKETIVLARCKNVDCHTHLAETLDEEEYCMERYGTRPVALMEKLGWLGPDVWYAHCVHLNSEEIALMAETGTGVAHCPTSNLRLGSGIAPVREMLNQGVHVGLAVDGSASNDSSNMLAELRNAMLIHRIRSGVGSMPAMDVLEIATRGGAAVLGRNEIGSIEPSMAADMSFVNMNRLEFAGALHDPASTALFCVPGNRMDRVMVNGNFVVENGRLTTFDEDEIVRKANEISFKMVQRASSRTGKNFLKK